MTLNDIFKTVRTINSLAKLRDRDGLIVHVTPYDNGETGIRVSTSTRDEEVGRGTIPEEGGDLDSTRLEETLEKELAREKERGEQLLKQKRDEVWKLDAILSNL